MNKLGTNMNLRTKKDTCASGLVEIGRVKDTDALLRIGG